jgi:hypothetical protein
MSGCAPEEVQERTCFMSVSTLSVILALATCLVPSGETPSKGDRPRSSVAAVAGNYYFGDGLGINCSLTVRQEGHFSFSWRGCLGVYDENMGRAKVVAEHLVLSPERPNVQEGFSGTRTDFHVVRWGDRLYLIPEGDKQEFCNAVNGGIEPRSERHGRFYLRRGDWDKKVTGLPRVPKDWSPLLLKKPLRGRVIDVLSGGRARVDLGTDDGVWKGMELWVDTKGSGLVQVVEVGAKSSVISIKYPRLTPIRFQTGQGVRSELSDEP